MGNWGYNPTSRGFISPHPSRESLREVEITRLGLRTLVDVDSFFFFPVGACLNPGSQRVNIHNLFIFMKGILFFILHCSVMAGCNIYIGNVFEARNYKSCWMIRHHMCFHIASLGFHDFKQWPTQASSVDGLGVRLLRVNQGRRSQFKQTKTSSDSSWNTVPVPGNCFFLLIFVCWALSCYDINQWNFA